MNYRINLGAWRRVFAVPSCAADYLKTASGDQVKVLIYLLANADLGLRSADIAAAVGISASEVDDALLFWTENAKILCGSQEELAPSSYPHAETRPSPAGVSPEARAAVQAEVQFPPKEIAAAVRNDKAVDYLFGLYEKLAGRPTKHAERNSLMIIIEEIALPPEVAAMLVEYCFSIDKSSPAYMKKVALDWAEAGVDTIGKAEERIAMLSERNSFEARLKRRIGLETAFSAKQKAIIAEWIPLGLSDELIDEAYDAMIRNTGGKLSLSYMDGIFRRWQKDGITDISQLKKEKNSAGSDGSQGEGSSFDIDELDDIALKKYQG